jgi:tRNA threonylcarbamoyladenosine biosynthesis protein TsaE
LINLPFTVIVESENETEKIAKSFAENLIPGDLILLNGELGSGKTFFVKSVCNNFGIKNVASPSFTIVNEYSGDKKVYHFDFYRIKKVNELYDFGFEDYLNDINTIKFIEWANLWKEVIPKHFYEVNIDFVNENERKITISKQ